MIDATSDVNPIKTAVILCAGAGSRALRMTRVTDKPLLPIYAGKDTQASIDYAVGDCVVAGIKKIIFVTTERGSHQLREYFQELNPVLKQQLERVGKYEHIALEKERDEAYGVEFRYVTQPPHTYGTTAGLWCAKDLLVGEKQFVLMTGDDVIYNADRMRSDVADAIRDWQESGANHAVTGKIVKREDASKYGVFQLNDGGLFVGIDEKPPLERVPENPVANVSRYIFSDSIWKYMEKEMAIDKGKAEHLIVDPVTAAAADGYKFVVHRISSDYVYLDCGSYDGLEYAGNYVKNHPPFN
jgi:UTP-glucose-1-phosphate uridylyltransferase